MYFTLFALAMLRIYEVLILLLLYFIWVVWSQCQVRMRRCGPSFVKTCEQWSNLSFSSFFLRVQRAKTPRRAVLKFALWGLCIRWTYKIFRPRGLWGQEMWRVIVSFLPSLSNCCATCSNHLRNLLHFTKLCSRCSRWFGNFVVNRLCCSRLGRRVTAACKPRDSWRQDSTW